MHQFKYSLDDLRIFFDLRINDYEKRFWVEFQTLQKLVSKST